MSLESISKFILIAGECCLIQNQKPGHDIWMETESCEIGTSWFDLATHPNHQMMLESLELTDGDMGCLIANARHSSKWAVVFGVTWSVYSVDIPTSTQFAERILGALVIRECRSHLI